MFVSEFFYVSVIGYYWMGIFMAKSVSLFHFFPGFAASRLDALARESGKAKAAILRGLVAEAPLQDSEFFRLAHDRIVEGGRRIVACSRKPDFRAMAGLAAKVIEIAGIMDDHANAAGGHEELLPGRMAMVSEARGKSMAFRLKDQEGKLAALAMQASMSKAAVLRALTLGVRLPNDAAFRAYARLAQIGGLLRHVAGVYRDEQPGSGILFRHGILIGDIARERLVPMQEGKALAGRLDDNGDREADR